MDNYMNNFLINYKQRNVEKHSDSSDFDEIEIPCLSSKRGKRTHYNKKSQKHAKVKERGNLNSCKESIQNAEQGHPNSSMFDETMIPVRDNEVNANQDKKSRTETNTKVPNTGGEVTNCEPLLDNSNKINKPILHFSNISKGPNNNTQQISNVKNITQDNRNSAKSLCADCEHRRIKKFHRHRSSYVVRPTYVVDNMQGEPLSFTRTKVRPQNHMKKHISNTSYELTSSESDIGKIDRRKDTSRRRYLIGRFQKEMRKEYLKYEKELLKNRIQQYPSKRDNKFPYQAFSTPLCQATNTSKTNVDYITSTSSTFWEYFLDKIYEKVMVMKEDCAGQRDFNISSMAPPQKQQHTTNNTEEVSSNKTTEPNLQFQSYLQQTTETDMENSPKTLPATKIQNNAKCKCNTNKSSTQQKDVSNPPKESKTQDDEKLSLCQETHYNFTEVVKEKYNGEILCIHNPPCIVINGCLNLPHSNEHIFHRDDPHPTTQEKKSSFYHLCRKMKRAKRNRCDQACQYHLPRIEMQQSLQIKTEKIVQSICNHDPPCEVVYGCYKAKYDPNLNNSCVHVPMCQKMPECMTEEKQEMLRMDKICEHKPKCADVPLCSRKFVLVPAHDTVGTQVRPKSKLVCRHEPPCLMIPKCVACIISNGNISYEAIPDCTHLPPCDMIPACCRKSGKEMVSASSQFPKTPCPIV